MKIVECEREDCQGFVIWNEDIQAFVCDTCDTIHEKG
jgi:hypothetical protein